MEIRRKRMNVPRGDLRLSERTMIGKEIFDMARYIENMGIYLALVDQLDKLAVELERRCFGGADRTWSNVEFSKMLGKALAADRYDFILALYLARYAGLRIHECFRIDTATAEQALRENAITIKGKGGKVRTVPINEQITIAMRKQLERTPRGHKLLVPDDMHMDRTINLLQLFIMKHRDEVRDVGSDRPMAFHGLRHTFAAEKYKELISSSMRSHTAVSDIPNPSMNAFPHMRKQIYASPKLNTRSLSVFSNRLNLFLLQFGPHGRSTSPWAS